MWDISDSTHILVSLVAGLVSIEALVDSSEPRRQRLMRISWTRPALEILMTDVFLHEPEAKPAQYCDTVVIQGRLGLPGLIDP